MKYKEEALHSRAMFPDFIHDPSLVEGMDERILCANAMTAWGVCCIADKIPDTFGDAMVAVARKLGIQSAHRESLTQYAISKGWLTADD